MVLRRDGREKSALSAAPETLWGFTHQVPARPRHQLSHKLIGTLHPRPQVENLSLSLAGVCD